MPVYQAAETPKKKSSGCLIGAVVVVVLVACLGIGVLGVISLLPDIIPPELDFRTPTPSSPGMPSTGADAPIVVENLTGSDVCFLYISPSNSDDWGDDWLDTMVMIENGDSATFWVPAGQTVDMRAETCDGGANEQYDVYVPAEGITYTLTP